MIKYSALIMLFPSITLAMQENRPHYHINSKIVYKQEVHESGDHEFETVSDFTAAIDQENAAQKAQQDAATVERKMSTRTKAILSLLTCSGTIVVSVVSAIATYYSTSC